MAGVIASYHSRKQIELTNSLIARQVTFPPGWTRARVGIRAAFSGATHVTPMFALGICSGTTNVPGDASVTNFIGMYSSCLWTYTGSGRYASNTVNWGKVVGSTFSSAGSASGYDSSDVASYDYYPGWFVDILPGSPNYTIQTYLNDNNAPSNPMEGANFLNQMAVNGVLNGTWSGYYYAAHSIACNEGLDGPFNAICCYWSGVGVKLVIDEIAFAVF